MSNVGIVDARGCSFRLAVKEWNVGDFDMTTMEERVSRIEGGYEHLATKADVSNIRAELANLKVQLLLANITIGGIIVAVLRFWQ